MRGIYQAFNTSRGVMIKNHSITELKPEHSLVHCCLIKPIFAEDTVREIRERRNQVEAINLVSNNETKLADCRDWVERPNSV